MESIVQAVYKNSDRYPDKPALVYQGQAVTYRELYRRVTAFCTALKMRKVRKGSRIAMEADDVLSYFPAFLGCQLAQTLAVPLEKDVTAGQLEEIAGIVKPALVFSKHTGESLEEFYRPYLESAGSFPFPDMENECAIISTTGTTGKPERIVHTNKSIRTAVENLILGAQISEESVLLACAPFNLAFGYRRVFAGLCAGATLVLLHNISTADEFFGLVEEWKVNHLALIPSDLSLLLRADSAKLNEAAKQIRAVQTAIYPFSAKDKDEFLRRYPGVTLYNVYGTSESGCCIINNCNENPKDGCIGKPAPYAEVELVDKMGNKIEKSGEYGYIAVKGDMNMKCYYKKKALTDKVKKDGYIVTNDVAYYDKEGNLFFISRVSDIINVSGRKVIPEKIERAATEFPGVKECACTPRRDAKKGQTPKIFVVFAEGADADEEKLRQFLGKKLEPYEMPAEIEAVEKIPRTSTGKIMRKYLAELG